MYIFTCTTIAPENIYMDSYTFLHVHGHVLHTLFETINNLNTSVLLINNLNTLVLLTLSEDLSESCHTINQ